MPKFVVWPSVAVLCLYATNATTDTTSIITVNKQSRLYNIPATHPYISHCLWLLT